MTPEEQIEQLACFIMKHIPGEPSRNEGAVECAIRLLGEREVAIRDAVEEEREVWKNALRNVRCVLPDDANDVEGESRIIRTAINQRKEKKG